MTAVTTKRGQLTCWVRCLLGAATLAWAANSSALELRSGYQVISEAESKTLPWTTGGIVPGNKPGWYYSTNMVPFLGYGQVGTVLVSAAPLATGECVNMFPMASYDGYRGYEIAAGILVIPFGTMTGKMVLTAGTMNPSTNGGTFTPNANPGLNVTSSASWDKFGTGSGDLSTRSDCFGVGTTYTVANAVVEMNTDGGTQAVIGYGVYVKPGTAKMPTKTVYLQAARGYRWNATPSTFDVRTFALTWSGMDCTLSTDASIPFGDITPADVGTPGGISVASTLDMNCSNPSGNAIPVSYSVVPKTQAGDHYSVPLMSETQNGTVNGDVRGFLGATASADAGCVDKGSSMPMDGTKTSLRTVTTGTSWSDPLVWVLCPSAAAAPGPAKATVTLDLNW
ncbi:MAG: hypothetical protein ACRDCA_10490 [Serratia sp. (in: enterobacteria)]|uniref:hypothetical protein n=1 Tax=Serratia sp. (in: enterobacteria) TaxID=616 RepID=UPI003F34D36D